MIETKSIVLEKTILIGVINNKQDEKKSKDYLDELAFLVHTAGGKVVRSARKIGHAHVGDPAVPEDDAVAIGREEGQRVGLLLSLVETSLISRPLRIPEEGPLRVNSVIDQPHTDEQREGGPQSDKRESMPVCVGCRHLDLRIGNKGIQRLALDAQG